MSNSWISQTIRFRPDQIARFQELYPDKQLSPLLRMLLDTFLDGKKPTQKRAEEIRKLKEKMQKQIAMLEMEEDELQKEEQKEIMGEALDKYRIEYIQIHPDILEQFKANAISHKGYMHLQKELKYSDKQKLIEFLKSQISPGIKIEAIL